MKFLKKGVQTISRFWRVGWSFRTEEGKVKFFGWDEKMIFFSENWISEKGVETEKKLIDFELKFCDWKWCGENGGGVKKTYGLRLVFFLENYGVTFSLIFFSKCDWLWCGDFWKMFEKWRGQCGEVAQVRCIYYYLRFD